MRRTIETVGKYSLSAANYFRFCLGAYALTSIAEKDKSCAVLNDIQFTEHVQLWLFIAVYIFGAKIHNIIMAQEISVLTKSAVEGTKYEDLMTCNQLAVMISNQLKL